MKLSSLVFKAVKKVSNLNVKETTSMICKGIVKADEGIGYLLTEVTQNIKAAYLEETK